MSAQVCLRGHIAVLRATITLAPGDGGRCSPKLPGTELSVQGGPIYNTPDHQFYQRILETETSPHLSFYLVYMSTTPGVGKMGDKAWGGQ